MSNYVPLNSNILVQMEHKEKNTNSQTPVSGNNSGTWPAMGLIEKIQTIPFIL